MNNTESESLYHYTGKDGFMSILTNGLKFSYCLETFDDINVCIPMICFCDIPLKSSNEHRKRYGDYVLSLSKKSLIDSDFCNYINPVFYHQSEGVTKAIQHIHKTKNKISNTFDKYKKGAEYIDSKGNTQFGWVDPAPSLISDFFELNEITKTETYLLGFSKKYYYEDAQGNTTINYCEKEWRLVMPDQHGSEWIWDKAKIQEFVNEKKEKKEKKEKLFSGDRLIFNVDDITHLIVPQIKDEELLIGKLCSTGFLLCGKTFDSEVLKEKVTSFERINC